MVRWRLRNTFSILPIFNDFLAMKLIQTQDIVLSNKKITPYLRFEITLYFTHHMTSNSIVTTTTIYSEDGTLDRESGFGHWCVSRSWSCLSKGFGL